jgi:hypothetical protein
MKKHSGAEAGRSVVIAASSIIVNGGKNRAKESERKKRFSVCNYVFFIDCWLFT